MMLILITQLILYLSDFSLLCNWCFNINIKLIFYGRLLWDSAHTLLVIKLPIYSLIYVSMKLWWLPILFDGFQSIITSIIIYFGTKLSIWLLHSFDMTIILWKLSLFSGTKSYFGLIFYFSYSVLERAILLRNSEFFYWKWYLETTKFESARWVYCYWDVTAFRRRAMKKWHWRKRIGIRRGIFLLRSSSFLPNYLFTIASDASYRYLKNLRIWKCS